MYKLFHIFLITFILLVTCGNDRQAMRGNIRTHAILKMELIKMPSPGKVEWVEGQAQLKKNDSGGYFPVYLNLEINDGDILWLMKDAVVHIAFEDGTYVANKPAKNESFFTFEIVSSNKWSENITHKYLHDL